MKISTIEDEKGNLARGFQNNVLHLLSIFSGSGLMEPCDIESIELRLDNYPLPGYPIEYNDGKPTYIIPIKNII